MELITSGQRDEILSTIERDAFHLELRDEYLSPIEDNPFRKWLNREPDDFAWLDEWASRIRTLTEAGKTVRRVRVITEPISEYIRWEHSNTRLNLEFGEDIRWLPRHHLPEGITFPRNGLDWWLLDDHLIAFGHFTEDGRVKGSEIATEPGTVAECVKVRDLLWSLATPHAEYKPV